MTEESKDDHSETHINDECPLTTGLCFQDDRQFECTVCGLRMKSQSSLVVHQRRHSGVYAYYCPVCGKGCSSKNTLSGHMVTAHNDETCKVRCQQCDKTFSRKDHLRAHLARMHPQEQLTQQPPWQ